jgi:hypothetical protein
MPIWRKAGETTFSTVPTEQPKALPNSFGVIHSFVENRKVFATTIGVVLCWMWKGNRFAPLGFAIACSPPALPMLSPVASLSATFANAVSQRYTPPRVVIASIQTTRCL